MTMSAPSAISRATSRSASSELAGVHLIGVFVAACRAARPSRRLRETGHRSWKRTWRRRRECACGSSPRSRRRRGSRRCARPSCRRARPRRRPRQRGARLPHQRLDREIVQHVAGLVDQTVLAVGGEGIERHVGDDAELRKFLFDGAYRLAGRCPPGFQDSRASRDFFSAE